MAKENQTDRARRRSTRGLKGPLVSASSSQNIERNSLPSSPAKNDVVAQSKNLTFHSPSEQNKENINKKCKIPESPRVTPYWEVVAEGRASSPRVTRSSAKKKKMSGGSLEIGETGRTLEFSPPNNKANKIREGKEMMRKEFERSMKIQQARENGQLLTFSPPKKNRTSSATCSSVSPKLSPEYDSTSRTDKDEIIGKRKFKDSDDTVLTSPLKKRKTRDVNQRCKNSNQKKAKEGTVDDTLEKLKRMEESNAKLFEDLQTHRNESKNHHDQLKKQMDQMSKAMVEKGITTVDVHAAVKGKDARIAALTNDNQKLGKEIQDMKDKFYEEVELVRKKSEVIIDGWRKKSQDSDAKLSDLSTAAEANKNNLSELEISLELMTKENKEWKEFNKKYKKQLEEKEKAERELKDELECLREELHKINTQKAQDLEQLLSENERYAKQLTEITSSLKLVEQRCEEAVQGRNETKRQLEEEITLREAEKEEILRLQKSLERLKKMEESVNALKLKAEESESKVIDLSAENKKNALQLSDLASSLTVATKKYKEEKDRSKELLEQLDEQSRGRKEDNKVILSLQEDLQKAENYIAKQKRVVKEKDTELQNVLAERDSVITDVVKFNKREEELNRRVKVLDEVRRVLHNKVMRLSGNMKVFVRVRPIIDREAAELQRISIDSTPTNKSKSPFKRHCSKTKEENVQNTPFHFPSVCDRNLTYSAPNSSHQDLSKKIIQVTEPYKDRGGLNPRRQKWSFGFDGVFTPSHTQKDMWFACEPMVQSAVDGYNVCIFAYGQTGAGKTYTMFGDDQNPGIISEAVKKIFAAKEEIEITSRGALKVSIRTEMLEIYNEKLRDLLDQSSGNKEINLEVKANEDIGNIVTPVECEDEVARLLHFAQKRRCVKATNSNLESSRSHTLFTLHFVIESEKDSRLNRVSKLHICDLAGSERLAKSASSGDLLKETQHINSSLSALSNVIESLQSKKSHVPFRDSKLTFILQDSLGGDSKTLAIVCCNPLSAHYHESLCSLRFAEKMNRVELKTKHIPK